MELGALGIGPWGHIEPMPTSRRRGERLSTTRNTLWLTGCRLTGDVLNLMLFVLISNWRTSLESALMESLANNHGFLDGNKRIAFTAADVFLRRNGFYIEVEGSDGHAFIYGSMDRGEFRFAQILDWIRQHIKPLV